MQMSEKQLRPLHIRQMRGRVQKAPAITGKGTTGHEETKADDDFQYDPDLCGNLARIISDYQQYTRTEACFAGDHGVQ